MSLIIKCNIGLPPGCKSCPFNYTDVCIASNKGIDTRAFVHLRHPDCPMVELPTPHGRMIDADAIDYPLDWQGEIVKAVINQASTIIEAEGVNE